MRLPLREEPAEDEARAGDLTASPHNAVVKWIRGRPRVVPPTARGRRRGGATAEVEVGGAGLTDDELARIEAAEGRRCGSCLRPDHGQSRCPASVVEDGGAAAPDRRRDRAVEDEVGRATNVAMLPQGRRCAAEDLVPANHGATTGTSDRVLCPDPLRTAGTLVIDGDRLCEARIQRVERV